MIQTRPFCFHQSSLACPLQRTRLEKQILLAFLDNLDALQIYANRLKDCSRLVLFHTTRIDHTQYVMDGLVLHVETRKFIS